MTILWIEDDFGLDETLGDWFRYIAGWEVIHATGPRQGLELLREHLSRIDLVILDLMMPPEGVVDNLKSDYGKDTGLLLIERINDISGGDLPIVILSARQEALGPLAEHPSVKARLEKSLGLEGIVDGVRRAVPEIGRSSRS